MRTHVHRIPDEIKAILARADITGNTLKITERLDRPTYTAVNKVLELAGGKWNRKAQSHLFSGDPREILGLAIERGAIVDEKKSFNFFPTPPALAKRMAALADIRPAMHVLEPSAGTGNIWRELSGKRIAYEVNPKMAEHLQGMTCLHDWVYCRDFLTVDPSSDPALMLVDRVVMNPPFDRGDDIKHILHARKFLKPDGLLVAICANGPRQQEKLQPLCDSWEELPAGTFKESGTNISTVLLTMSAEDAEETACVDCGQEVGNAETMVRNAGISHLEPCPIPNENAHDPTLGQNAQEADRLLYAGRPDTALRFAKRFDSEKLQSMPLFKRGLFD